MQICCGVPGNLRSFSGKWFLNFVENNFFQNVILISDYGLVIRDKFRRRLPVLHSSLTDDIAVVLDQGALVLLDDQHVFQTGTNNGILSASDQRYWNTELANTVINSDDATRIFWMALPTQLWHL